MLILENISLKDKNWFRTGGIARFFCEPKTVADFQQALLFVKNNNLDHFVLGEGANILISDDIFDGLIIHPSCNAITHKEENGSLLVTAEAGATMNELIEYCLDNNIIGLEEFSQIPGTVGGSVYINLHYFQFFISDFFIQGNVIEKTTGHSFEAQKDWFAFGYDQSTLMKKNHYLMSATFVLKKGSDLEVAYARGRRTEIIRHRIARYPTKNTCGSFFRNFHDNEVTLYSNGKKMIYTAYYLDKIGVKGELAVGDAQVSYQHANMIVNRGNATSNDIVQVARIMQKKVYDTFNIIPQPECQLVGFKQYPLL